MSGLDVYLFAELTLKLQTEISGNHGYFDQVFENPLDPTLEVLDKLITEYPQLFVLVKCSLRLLFQHHFPNLHTVKQMSPTLVHRTFKSLIIVVVIYILGVRLLSLKFW